MQENELVKIDLHCHLDGSIPQNTVRILAEQAGVTLPVSEEELTRSLMVGTECRSLKEYLEKFELPLSCLVSEKSFETAMYEVMKKASEENVKYMEVRFAPLLSERTELPSEKIVQTKRNRDRNVSCQQYSDKGSGDNGSISVQEIF